MIALVNHVRYLLDVINQETTLCQNDISKSRNEIIIVANV